MNRTDYLAQFVKSEHCEFPGCNGAPRSNLRLCKSHNMRRRQYRDLSVDQFLELISRGKCDICGKPEQKIGGHVIDHDHVTQRVRGYLCRSCNSGIERVTDPKWMPIAEEYLGRQHAPLPAT